MKKKNEFSLLPHIKEDIFGLDTQSVQMIGWELSKFNIPNLWSISTGKNVTVGVIDTGCDLYHDDIKNNVISGKNFIDPKKDPIDDNSHGTHVAGTIAAENNITGMVGVAPNTKIMPLKALNGDGNGNEKSITDAILHGANNKCDFLCMSLGSPFKSEKIHSAIKYAASKGCIIFCAAGNSGENKPIMYPAKFDEVIAIGAIDKNFNRTSFTCTGNELDFLSPGHDIFSCVPNNKYALMSGTSMATPYAVGCACLVKSSINTKLSMNQLINIFNKTAKKLTQPKYQEKKYQGNGIISLTKDSFLHT